MGSWTSIGLMACNAPRLAHPEPEERLIASLSRSVCPGASDCIGEIGGIAERLG